MPEECHYPQYRTTVLDSPLALLQLYSQTTSMILILSQNLEGLKGEVSQYSGVRLSWEFVLLRHSLQRAGSFTGRRFRFHIIWYSS